MNDKISNDNGFVQSRSPESDAHGQAAMLLSESILHGLIARSIISVPEAIEIVDVAMEVNAEIAEDLGHSAAATQKSVALLGAIRSSLAHDLTVDGG